MHSRYRRTLFDLLIAARPVRLQLQARRFLCTTPDCPRSIFAERLPSLTRPYARRTSRMATALTHIGLALGGEAGARLAGDLQLPTSPDTLLRLVRSTEEQFTARAGGPRSQEGAEDCQHSVIATAGSSAASASAPRVLGVDDWAKRKGQTYGSILCDLETSAVVDLLPDREASTLAEWLRKHPGVEIISRDRGGAYAGGARQGAPDARQVADRFHILCNLGAALEELIGRLYHELSRLYSNDANDEDHMDISGTNAANATTPEPAIYLTAGPQTTARATRRPKCRQRDIERSHARRSTRLARYEEVVQLSRLGWSQIAIAEHLNLCRKTVGRWLSKGSFPEYKYPVVRRSKLDPYKAFLHERWEQGCTNARQIWREMREQGYRGGHTVVRDYVATLRQLDLVQYEGVTIGGEGSCPPRRPRRPKHLKLPSPRQLRWLLLKPVEQLNDEQYRTVLKLCQYSKEVTLTYGLVTDFQSLVRYRRAEHLSSWVELVLASGVPEVASFARGVQRDFAAVYAGMELPWSQGPVQGHVNG